MAVTAKQSTSSRHQARRIRSFSTLSLAFATLLLAPKPVLSGVVPSATPEDVGLSSQRLQRVSQVVQKHVAAGDVAGAVTLVARRGSIVHFDAQGVMDVDSGQAMPRDTIFRLASMSKPITSVAIMMLVEEGEIQLRDPVSKFIPQFSTLNQVAVAKPGTDSTRAGEDGETAFDLVTAQRAITIRDLLTHGSGLISGGLGGRAAAEIAPRTPRDTLATYIPKLAAVPLDFQPGTLWRYSGLAGFEVLSRVVEVVSGLAFDEFLEQRLFEPLGMQDTAFYFRGDQVERVATMHARTPEGLQATQRDLDHVYFSGAGGLASTAEDYLQFAQMLLNGGELDGKRYLSPRTVELMITNHTGDMVNGQFGRPEKGMGFGLSMQLVQDPVAADLAVSKGAYGWAGGTGVSFWIEPREELVSIFMIQGGSARDLRSGFENAVRQAITD